MQRRVAVAVETGAARARKMPDETLIPIWVKIWRITDGLRWCESSPLFVPGVGDVQIADYSPEVLNPLRAIFAVHGKRIELELPEDLRNKPWVDMLDPATVRVKDRLSFFVARSRIQLLERLRETAMFTVQVHREAALIKKDIDGGDLAGCSVSGGKGTGGAEATLIDEATLAMAIIFKNPEISPTDLARQVGVSRGTLYSRSKKWIDVRRTLMARDKGEALQGTKSADGELDATGECREFDPIDDE